MNELSVNALPKVHKSTNKNIPIARILDLRKKGLSYSQIGKIIGCSKTNISARLSNHAKNIAGLQPFKKHRADIFALKGMEIVNCLTPAKIKKASAYQLAGMQSIFYNQERLERDKSTNNLSILIGNVGALRHKQQALEEAIGEDDID